MVAENKLKEAVSSGVSPLKLLKFNIRDCSTHSVKACRTELIVNSMELGVMPPNHYASTAEKSGLDIPLCERVLIQVSEKLHELKETKSRIEWVACRFPLSLLKSPDLSDTLKKYFPVDGERSMLCLEFPATILNEDPADLEKAFYTLKLLGVRTMVSGIGSKNCPVVRLLSFSFNYVLLDESLIPLMKNEGTAPAAEGIARLAASTKASVIAVGLTGDNEASQWYKAGCDSYIKEEEEAVLIEREGLEEIHV